MNGQTRECPEGKACNTASGFCEPESGCNASDCSPAQQCDQQTGECVARQCDADTDCPRGYICGDANRCTSGCRLDAPKCPANQICWRSPESDIGQCRNECASFRDCPYGQYCASNAGPSICEPEEPCDRDSDCRQQGHQDEVCRNGICSPPPCQSDEMCNDGEVCDKATGRCVGGSCQDDRLAPNQTWEEAAGIKFDTYTRLQLCPGHSDWFSLEVDSNDAVSIRVEHEAVYDLDFIVYDEERQPVAVNQQAPPNNARGGRFSSTATFLAEKAQTLMIRVYSTSREQDENAVTEPEPVDTTYELRVSDARNLFCSDDGFEENDSRQTARSVPSAIGADLEFNNRQICGGDADWYHLADVSGDAQLHSSLRSEADHLQLDVYSELGAHYRRSPVETLDLVRTSGGEQDWYLRVSSRRKRSASYTLSYRVDSPWECPEDGKHGNPEDAVSLSRETETTYALCPRDKKWEVDWIDLESPNSTKRLEIEVTVTQSLPEVRVEVFEKQPSGLSILHRAARLADIYSAVLQVDPEQDLVLRIGSDTEPGPLRNKPRYDVVYRFTPTQN